ncbi:hypothetical protein A2U01_0027562 [Trifolium medium]|uniref:Uncharacterized protein n=1 Tax=Trifolium medium TaxID=97028 RepID=A0A392P432_9FABA|nr:hypothetical protein [Trifolium medium]
MLVYRISSNGIVIGFGLNGISTVETVKILDTGGFCGGEKIISGGFGGGSGGGGELVFEGKFGGLGGETDGDGSAPATEKTLNSSGDVEYGGYGFGDGNGVAVEARRWRCGWVVL